MQRRELLQFAALASLASACAPGSDRLRGMRVVVVGAGIVGASIAYFVSRAGAQVTIIDRDAPARHASRGTFAWINATWAKQPQHYHRLNQRSVERWPALAGELGIPVRWGGSIEWFATPQRQTRLAEQIVEQQNWGEPARMIDAQELARLEPGLTPGTAKQFAYSPRDGAIDPIAATNALLDAAQHQGAKLRYPCEALGVKRERGQLRAVTTSTGPIAADQLILATGADPSTPKRCTNIDIPQRPTPGIIALTQPMPRVLNTIVVAPGVHLHQRSDGRVVLGEQAGPPDTTAHSARLRKRPNEFPDAETAIAHGQRILATARRYVPELAEARIASAVIGWRPLPLDGLPVLGQSPQAQGIHIAIMHSGVTLAPIVGELIAASLSVDTDVNTGAALSAYSPTRDFHNAGHY